MAFTTASMSLTNIALVAVVVAPLFYVCYEYAKVLALRRKMPPGPFPLPLVGNYFQIPKIKPWIKFEEWAKTYDNPMTTLWQGSRPTIMCNDAWTISDLMEKRANIYSSRPPMVMLGDLVNSTDSNQVCLPYGDRWRLHRRLTVRLRLDCILHC